MAGGWWLVAGGWWHQLHRFFSKVANFVLAQSQQFVYCI